MLCKPQGYADRLAMQGANVMQTFSLCKPPRYAGTVGKLNVRFRFQITDVGIFSFGAFVALMSGQSAYFWSRFCVPSSLEFWKNRSVPPIARYPDGLLACLVDWDHAGVLRLKIEIYDL